jgi:hypothetical protein
MDCEDFFDAVDRRLTGRYREPTRTTAGTQCVVDFFHPRIVARFGTDGLATRFNRSGVVWAPAGARLGVELRVPATHEAAVAAALADAPFAFDCTDHRGVTAPGGETVTVLHFTAREADVDRTARDATLDAVADALAV